MSQEISPVSSLVLSQSLGEDAFWRLTEKDRESGEAGLSKSPKNYEYEPYSRLAEPQFLSRSESFAIPLPERTYNLDSPAEGSLEKDLAECAQLFGIMPASPISNHSDSSYSSTSQISDRFRSTSPPITTSRGSDSRSPISFSPEPSHASTLPARIHSKSYMFDGIETYWLSRSRETRMSIYSAMQPSNNDTDPAIISMQVCTSDSTEPVLAEPDTEPPTEASSESTFPETFPVSRSPRRTTVDENSLASKDSKKLAKKERDETKALKKREKSVQKLQKELAMLEKRRVSCNSPHLRPASSGPQFPLTLDAVPTTSLKIEKSGGVSMSPPASPRIPSEPTSPSSTSKQVWRSGSTSLSSLDNISPRCFVSAPTLSTSSTDN